jgi:hypothetical protein
LSRKLRYGFWFSGLWKQINMIRFMSLRRHDERSSRRKFLNLSLNGLLIFPYLSASRRKLLFFERWNIVELDDIRFYGVAPHWYFRAYMGILTVCPSHYEGLAFAGGYMVLLAALPALYVFYNKSCFKTNTIIPAELSITHTFAFIFFLSSLNCVSSMLPCGRYYYDIEGGYVGNPWVKISYQYIIFYLGWLLHHLDRIDTLFHRRSYIFIFSTRTK